MDLLRCKSDVLTSRCVADIHQHGGVNVMQSQLNHFLHFAREDIPYAKKRTWRFFSNSVYRVD